MPRRAAARLRRFEEWLADRPRDAVLLVFAAAMVVRLAVAFVALGVDFLGDGDSDLYLALATNLAERRGYVDPTTLAPTAYRPVGYPAFVAGLWAVTGVGNMVVLKAVEAVIGAGTCALVAVLAWRLFGSRAGLLAGVIAVLYPALIYYPSAVMTENLFTFLLMAFAVLLHEAYERDANILYVAAGLMLGLAILTRPILLLMPAFVGVWALLSYRRLMPAMRVALVVGLSTLVVVAPWTARNIVVMDGFVTVSTNGGLSFWQNNNPVGFADRNDDGRWRPYTELPHADELAALDELDREARAYELALEAISAQPALVPRHMAEKLWNFWDPVPDRSQAEMLASALSFGPVLLLAAGGMVVDRRLGTRIAPYVIVLFVVSAAVYAGRPRTRFPIEPFLITYAAFMVARLVAWYRRRADGSTTPHGKAVAG